MEIRSITLKGKVIGPILQGLMYLCDMANYLQADHLSKSFGTKVLFDDVSFLINEGDKIALIAPNGSGKTSLLHMLAGKESSERGGSVTFLKDVRVAYLEQQVVYDPARSIFEEVFFGCPELYAAVQAYRTACQGQDKARLEAAIHGMDVWGGWDYETRINQMLTTLNVPHSQRLMGTLSGGEVKRVAVAIMLLQQADFLIMDEPTNHLDIEIIEYLEDLLRKSRATVFMVTHDRYFLDRVCNTIFELEGGHIYTYKGNYASFLEKREERIANKMAVTEKAKNIYRRELEWMRSTPQARTGKAKYRIDAFYDLQDRARFSYDDRKVNIDVQTARLGKKIINCKHLNYSLGDACLLRDFTYNFARYEKVGVVGDNGVGKTTFLKILTGEWKAQSGEIEHGETVSFGYYRQEGMAFNPNDTVFDAVHNIAETVTLADGTRLTANAFLQRFLFPPNSHNTPISCLSGGERRRLYLLCILMRNPNFLILDEPTNDLDIMTLNVLEDYLADFKGCLLIVSHDRYFLDKLADHLFVFTGGGQVKDYVGPCSAYRQYIKSLGAGANAGEAARQPAKAAPAHDVAKADAKASSKKRTWKQERQMEQLEAQVAELEAEKKHIEAMLAANEAPADQITEAASRLGVILPQLDAYETQLLELYALE